MMKTLIKTTAILILLLTAITSCDDVKDLADIDKDVVLTEYFTVNLDGGSDAIAYENSNISILTSAIEPYKDKLKKVKIQKVTFEIVDYNGDPSAEFEVKFSTDGTLFMNESFIASQADANGVIFEVSDTPALNTLATKLLNNNTVTISLSAEANNLEGAAYFRVQTKFYIVVTANPL